MASSLKAIVVDDEQPAREVLIHCIRDFCPDLEVVAECANAENAYRAIVDKHPDLVFLDIEMPGLSGFELLDMFHPVFFHVIFVTAFPDYAVRAFRCAASDFLLKPVDVRELVEAVAKVRNGISPANHNVSLPKENFHTGDPGTKKLAIPNSRGFDVVKTSDIILCKADAYCTHLFLSGNIKMVCSHLLKYFEDLLPPEEFMRVHHSYIINKEHVRGYTHQGEIILSEDIRCPLSAARKNEFIRIYKPSK